MKKTLWTFGDSQTFGHGCRPDGPLTEYYFNYKGENDDIWPELLGQKLNMNVRNFGECGASNDYIFDKMIENFENINEDDYVILGKTAHQRFDVRDYNTNKLFHVLGEMPIYIDDKETNEQWLRKHCRSQEEFETIINFVYYFAQDELYKERQDLRFQFIRKRLVNERKIGYYYEWSIFDDYMYYFHTIAKHTDQKIKDYHLSFKGHRQLSELIFQKIQSEVYHNHKLL